MKILHLISYFNDQLNYQENFLTKYQAQQGHTVQILTSDRYYPFQDYQKIYYPILGERIISKRKYMINGVQVIRKNLFRNKKVFSMFIF